MTRSRRYLYAAAVVMVLVGVAALMLTEFMPREKHLRGLLIDLELHGPDSTRYADLREAFTHRLTAEVTSLRLVRVTLDYRHFSEVDPNRFDSRQCDFLVLSPQGTPWSRYQGDARERLDALKRLVQRLALEESLPVLGICGGHQFMALAFGGAVGFIDPRLAGATPERYPRDAIAERGPVLLRTLTDDQIFSGITVHPGCLTVVESHYEEVKTVPKPFVNLARSEMSEAQLIRIPGKTVYGTAFHPERGWARGTEPISSDGKLILANFLQMVATHERASR